MDFFRDDPVILAFAVLGALLLLAVVISMLMKSSGPLASLPKQNSKPVRFTNKIEIIIVLLVVLPMVVVIGAWILNAIR